MINAIIAGVWGCLVALAVVYVNYSSNIQGDKSSTAEERPLELIRLDPITVPVLGQEGVDGYILAVLNISIDHGALEKPMPDLKVVLQDSAFRSLYGMDAVKYRKPRKSDLDELSKNIVVAMNQRVGVDCIKDVLLHEFSFVSKEQTRKR